MSVLANFLCPRCRTTALRAEGPALCCLRCGGLLLRGVAADSVRLALDPGSQEAAERTRGGPFARVDLQGPASCPVCRVHMQRFPAGAVEVDTCGEHGTWYDAGELLAVRDALIARGVSAAVAAPAPAALPPSPPPARPVPVLPTSSGLELADVPARRRSAPAAAPPMHDFKTADAARRRAEAQEDLENPSFDVLGAVLGMIGMTVDAPVTDYRRRRRHRHRSRSRDASLFIRAIERAIYD